MLIEDGKIDASLFVDGLHPNNDGYERVAKAFTEKYEK
jgi:lysophospholipase L1-like esterase